MTELVLLASSLAAASALTLVCLWRDWLLAAALAFGSMLPLYVLLLLSSPAAVGVAVAIVLIADVAMVALAITLTLCVLRAFDPAAEPPLEPLDWDEFDALRADWSAQADGS